MIIRYFILDQARVNCMTDFTLLVLKNMINIGELLMKKSLLHVKLMETPNLHLSSLLMVKLLHKALDRMQHQS